MITVFINNEIAYVPSNTTILEACEFIGIEIPRFCFHRRLTVAGNCRMCLVEIQKSPKPIASCATPVINNMQIFTNTPLVKKSRESVLEYLLVNHPLDCPICDQGGECDLQEQTILFGSDTTRFFDNKRSVENKFFGALVKTVLTRCILCTRCVRFAHDIAGVETLGTTSRGVTTEINFYIQKIFQSELSGNVIDLCPVGALTAKSYTFGARPWEIRSLNAIDLTDAVGSNIRVDFKEKEVIRILPRLKESLNDEWISDKARFNFDYLKKQKVDLWWVRQHKYSKPNLFRQDLIKTSFRKALHGNPQLQKKHILCSVNTDIGFLIKIKSVADILGIKNIGFSRVFFLNIDFSENFLCNTSQTAIKKSDFCLLVGANPRYEACILNLKIRKRFRKGILKFFSIGIPHSLTYKTQYLGITPRNLVRISEGNHFLCKDLKAAKKPIIVLSICISERNDFNGLQKKLFLIKLNTKIVSSDWNGFCFLNQESNQVGAFYVGLESFKFNLLKSFSFFSRKNSSIFLLGAFRHSELDFLEKRVLSYSFDIKNYPYTILNLQIFFMGTNSCGFVARFAHALKPTLNFLEKGGSFINLEGRVQESVKLVKMPYYDEDFFFFNQEILPYKKWLVCKKQKNRVEKKVYQVSFYASKKRNKNSSFISNLPFSPYLTDFFISDSLSRFSTTMLKCSNYYRASFKNFLS